MSDNFFTKLQKDGVIPSELGPIKSPDNHSAIFWQIA